LQHQGVANALAFSWGAIGEAAPHLPRVVHGKLVLAFERWNVSSRVFEPVKKAKKAERDAAFARFREALSLPRRVALADLDHVLPIDFENALSREAFFQLVKERSRFTLLELPGQDELCLRGPEGRFLHELVVPFVKKDAPVSSGETRPLVPGERSFAPGSRWLFVKVYTGTGTADHVLRALVGPLVEEVLAKGLATRWFFLRFADPRPHVRLRFEGPVEAILPLLHARAAPLLAEGRLARIQLDTYERELERYGGEEGVSLAEKLFQADSACALRVIAATPGDQGADLRWRLLVRGMDQLLEDLGLSLEERRALVRREKDGYGAELGADDSFWRQLGARFRRERGTLEPLLDRAQDATSPHRAALAAFAARSEVVRALAPEIKKLPLPVATLAASYLHMHANRLLRTAQRSQEACLHYFLDRCYEAILARRRSG
jgi:thiopeptide-type bacteriocin biosynthesis protein